MAGFWEIKVLCYFGLKARGGLVAGDPSIQDYLGSTFMMRGDSSSFPPIGRVWWITVLPNWKIAVTKPLSDALIEAEALSTKRALKT